MGVVVTSVLKRRLGIAVMLAVLAVSLAGFSAPNATALNTAGTTDGAKCADVLVVGVRGSGELWSSSQFGMGGPVSSTYRQLKKDLDAKGISVEPLGLNYPAVSVAYAGLTAEFSSYNGSVLLGVDEAQRQLMTWLTSCTGKVMLVGYSQGADVLTRLLQVTVLSGYIDDFGEDVQLGDRVLGTVFFGNSQFNPRNSYNVNTGYNKKLYGVVDAVSPGNYFSGILSSYEHGTRSYCLPKDPVCNFSLGNVSLCNPFGNMSRCTHLWYENKGSSLNAGKSSTIDAGNWLAQRAVNPVLAQPRILTGTLPDGIARQPYRYTMQADRGRSPYNWSVPLGMPAWLTINARTGLLSGTPAVGGSANLLVYLKDSRGRLAVRSLSILVHS
jgi:hypothetical protein